MKQGRTLTELAQKLERDRDAKRDYIADTRDVVMTPEDNLLKLDNGTEAEPTDHCHNQIASYTGIGRRYYRKMQESSPALLAGNVNHWLHEDDNADRRMIRTLDGKARAWLSDRYLRLDNEHVAETALKALENVDDVEIASCEVTERKLYIKALFPKTEGEVTVGDVVQSGVIITNSEIGLGSFEAYRYIHRLVCLNGMVSMNKTDSFRRIHRGAKINTNGRIRYQQDTIEAAAQAALLECRDAVATFADPEAFDDTLARMRQATEGEKIAKPKQAVEELGKSLSLSGDEQDSILERLIRGGDYSRWGVLNAVTNLANDADDYDRATELEQAGGVILDLPRNQWERIARAA